MVLSRYLRDGLATNKSDVYAFGVVLFEVISGKEAITRTDGAASKNCERRSLASIVSPAELFDFNFSPPAAKTCTFALVNLQMLAALRNSADSMSMSSLKDHIDPNLMDLYPHDCLFKVIYLISLFQLAYAMFINCGILFNVIDM